MTDPRKEVLSDTVTLWLGDCRDVLPMIGPVDAVVTDPPYGIGWDRQAERDSNRKPGISAAHKGVYVASGWDDAPPPSALIISICSIAKYLVVFGGNYFNLPPSRCWLVWDKKTGDNEFADCELAWTNLEKPVRRIEHMWNGMLRKGGEDRNGHPTQKPLGVMSWAIGHLPNDADTILDPFMGSGTTGVACVNLGRSFIGIEREPKYYDIARRRISEALAAPRLPFAESPQIKQEALAL